ncbi:hypothetical protein Rmet_6614 (plasmid) [Cupriavidus metallidurans CH34]|uniref:Uncharacterized protein n=1 Tax=Cupriavidus metallidurans (strain ATCC 43123 / DSM 2839 / NBRC 102507 / CH34) TaxID=266264 RepID=D3DY43_CUPMC|nr:hypothetical protein Rmet_6614 [Cupriavidus metallidurans CH34]
MSASALLPARTIDIHTSSLNNHCINIQ